MRDWIKSISHLAPAIAIGFVLLSAYVGAVAYMTAEASAKPDRVETSVNTIAIAVLQAEGNDRTNRLIRIERKIDRIVSNLPPIEYWCRGADCEN